jgi:hypothetical protein
MVGFFSVKIGNNETDGIEGSMSTVFSFTEYEGGFSLV